MDTQERLWNIPFANDIDSSDFRRRPSMYNYFEDQLDKQDTRQEIEISIRNQMDEFIDIGINYIGNDLNVLSSEFLSEIINTVNEKILSIHHIDIILDDIVRLKTISKLTYEILYVDILDIIKNCCLKLNSNNPEDLLSIQESKLKELLIEDSNDKLKVATTMAAINKNVNEEALKRSYCLDLFDNDMDRFISNLLTPIIGKYSTNISALLYGKL